MEALHVIVGCVMASGPAPARIDEVAQQARRLRAAVLTRQDDKAVFVRFGATDAGLLALAGRLATSLATPSLRFGFAAGAKDPGDAAGDSLKLSQRGVEMAQELAEAAGHGEVLVTPQLALLLVDAGFCLRVRRLRLADGRELAACALDMDASDAATLQPDARPPLQAQAGDALGSAFMGLVAQGEQLRQQQQAADQRLGEGLAALQQGLEHLKRHDEREARLLAQFDRLEQRLAVIDGLDDRIERLHAAVIAQERQITQQLGRRDEVQSLTRACEVLTARTADAQRQLLLLAPSQAQVAALATESTGLGQALAEAQQRLDSAQRRLAALSQTAEAVEQQMQSLKGREAEIQALHTDLAGVRALATQSLHDLQALAASRDAVTQMRLELDRLLGASADTRAQLADLDARRQTISEVQASAGEATRMITDIELHLEALNEQRSEVEHVGEQLANLDFAVREAHNTLRALQRERELAERIGQELKTRRLGTAI